VKQAVAAGIVMIAASLVAMMFGRGAKGIVVAAGAFALVPCYLCYLSGTVAPAGGGRVIEWLGVRTYSIYLWQQPLTVCGWLPHLLHPVGALLATLVGGVWFHLFERPFLSPGRRTPHATENR
jgi:peptidoglycan/LPS O-acetylase OafA/YrhL